MDESSVSSYTALTGSHSAGNQYFDASTTRSLKSEAAKTQDKKGKKNKTEREDTREEAIDSLFNRIAAGEARPFAVVGCRWN